MTGIELLFWGAVLLPAYAYVGYPAALALLARGAARHRRPATAPAVTPTVSVLVAAFNEAACIADKIRSTLDQRYPHDALEIIVVSDGSTDGTDGVVRAQPDPRVRLFRQEPRAGKSSALNRAVRAARGEILIFTDANAIFAPDAIAHLVAAFADRRVGLVSGQGLYLPGAGTSTGSPVEGLSAAGGTEAVSNGYVRYEAWLKSSEGGLGFVAGADGAIYALRRSLYRDLGPAEVNDLLHPIQVALAGLLSRMEPRAHTVEPPSRDAAQELRRHVRMIAQGVSLTRRWLPRLVAARRWRAVTLLLSHRVLRWLTAPCLAVALTANVAVLGRHPIYGLTVAAQVVFYGLALGGLVAERLGHRPRLLALPYFFCVVSAAGAAGVVRGLRGAAAAVWSPAGVAPAERRA